MRRGGDTEKEGEEGEGKGAAATGGTCAPPKGQLWVSAPATETERDALPPSHSGTRLLSAMQIRCPTLPTDFLRSSNKVALAPPPQSNIKHEKLSKEALPGPRRLKRGFWVSPLLKLRKPICWGGGGRRGRQVRIRPGFGT